MGERGSKEKKVHEFHFRLEITWALLNDFEILTTFFNFLLSLFRPLKVGLTLLGQKFEMYIQVLDQPNTTEHKSMGLATPLGFIYVV